MRALGELGFLHPTAIQTEAIPEILNGSDLLGIAATGTGKTAAFALPILHKLAGDRKEGQRQRTKALVLSPTRELAAQTVEAFRRLGRPVGAHPALVVGGLSMRPQIDVLARSPEIVVATPGRLIDHLERGTVRLDSVGFLVLDEFDQMLEVGFLPAVRRIVARLPVDRQTLMFSATMPKEIAALSRQLQRQPKLISVSPPSTPAEKIDQRVVLVEPADKLAVLKTLLEEGDRQSRSLVFTRTKHGADKLVRQLVQAGFEAAAIHGNRSQSQRERALAGFRDGLTPILIATDIAARGIHVDAINLVVNFDMPNVAETYVHRIGRTARAGSGGTAISLCATGEREHLGAIESLIRRTLPAQRHRSAAPSAPNLGPASPPPVAAAPASRQRQPPRRRSDQGYRGHAAPDCGLAQLPMFRPAQSNR